MEIEVGEFVRTNKGLIDRVIGFDTENIIARCKKYSFWIENIVKHSKNLIDLIEVGDYVNGYEIDEFDDEEGNLYLGIPIYEDALMDCIEEVKPLNTINIKSVVTKQQFEQMKYRVEE